MKYLGFLEDLKKYENDATNVQVISRCYFPVGYEKSLSKIGTAIEIKITCYLKLGVRLILTGGCLDLIWTLPYTKS